MISPEVLKTDAKNAALELCDMAALKAGQVVVIGCSTSEVAGLKIGSASSLEIGAALFEAFYEVFSKKGICLAAQCCEHLNRAIVTESHAAAGYDVVNAVPIPNAGGAFAAAAFAGLSDPVLVEEIRADAGLDIGGTLIGMHLKKVAVPLRMQTTRIGAAAVTSARTRPKLIGGSRAVYDKRFL